METMTVYDFIAVMKTRNPEHPVEIAVDDNTATIEIKLLDWKKWEKFIKKSRVTFS